MELFRAEHLSFAYPDAAPCLKDVHFSIAPHSFSVLCGATGCGKSTLLRLLKRELTPRGSLTGARLFQGVPLETLDARTAAQKIGFVMQQPEQQLVTDKVWHELSFGLENMGVAPDVIRRRVAEIASYFGIAPWFDRSVASLSGGQKQLLNLAAVLVMQPELLLLDEPTAQLDPISAASFLQTLRRLNRDTGLTILLVEHRLGAVLPLCDHILVLADGTLRADGAVRSVLAQLSPDDPLLEAMPDAVQLFHRLRRPLPDCPLSVGEGQKLVRRYGNATRALPASAAPCSAQPPALSFDHVCFRYARSAPEILRNLCLTVQCGEIFCLLGANGSGKSTALRLAAGLLAPFTGKVRIFDKPLKKYSGQSLYQSCLAMLPQDVQTVFLRSTVREELSDAGASPDILPCDLTPLLDRHPYDLSGGEQQLVALAKALAQKPRLLLLDEPTKGLDAQARGGIVKVLRQLKAQGITVVAVTHDVALAAACADRCALCFRGEVIAADQPVPFFSENSYYTTDSSRITRGYYDGVITVADAAALCLQNGEVHDARNCESDRT